MVTTKKLKLTGLDHFALNVKDMQQAEEFYTETLGFKVIHRTKTKSGLKHIEIDAGNVAIALFESPGLNLEKAHKTMTEEGYLHFAFGALFGSFFAALGVGFFPTACVAEVLGLGFVAATRQEGKAKGSK